MTAANWTLVNTTGQIQFEHAKILLELQQPANGLWLSNNGTTTSDSRFLRLHGINESGTELSPAPYIRGCDLIANYDGAEHTNLSSQLYWRALHHPACFGVEVIVSVQTSLLDYRQEFTVQSSGLTDVVHLADSAVLAAFGNEPGHYLEMVHPTDFCSTTVTENSTNWRILNQRLEKGVIRRARMQAWGITSEQPQSTAEALQRSFADSEPPLTV